MIEPGSKIGNYKVTRLLGEGGMGRVFEGVHEQIGRRAAIKVLHAQFAHNSEAYTRFLNEARAVNIIQHPGLVNVFEFGQTEDGSPYIVMEFLEGETLADRLVSVGRMSMGALRIARQIASALMAAHAKHIVHRDLKPANVMLVPDPDMPGGERVKVVDFGIAKISAEHNDTGYKTRAGAILGTPTYMSPEQCRGAGEVTDKTDVYALGVMIYEMLVGRPPFVAEGGGEIMGMHLFQQPPPLHMAEPSLPLDLVDLVHGMLSKDPAARPTINQVAQELDRIGGRLSGPMPAVTPEMAAASSEPRPPGPLTIPIDARLQTQKTSVSLPQVTLPPAAHPPVTPHLVTPSYVTPAPYTPYVTPLGYTPSYVTPAPYHPTPITPPPLTPIPIAPSQGTPAPGNAPAGAVGPGGTDPGHVNRTQILPPDAPAAADAPAPTPAAAGSAPPPPGAPPPATESIAAADSGTPIASTESAAPAGAPPAGVPPLAAGPAAPDAAPTSAEAAVAGTSGADADSATLVAADTSSPASPAAPVAVPVAESTGDSGRIKASPHAATIGVSSAPLGASPTPTPDAPVPDAPVPPSPATPASAAPGLAPLSTAVVGKAPPIVVPVAPSSVSGGAREDRRALRIVLIGLALAAVILVAGVVGSLLMRSQGPQPPTPPPAATPEAAPLSTTATPPPAATGPAATAAMVDAGTATAAGTASTAPAGNPPAATDPTAAPRAPGAAGGMAGPAAVSPDDSGPVDAGVADADTKPKKKKLLRRKKGLRNDEIEYLD